MKFSFNKNLKSTGIDFGSASIKALELEFEKNRILVTGMGKVETPKKETEGDLLNGAMVGALKALVSKAGIKNRKVICSLPSSIINVRHLRLPNLSKDELRDVLPIEAEGHLDKKVEDLVIDFTVVGEVLEKGQKKKEAILVWVLKEDVNQLLLWLREAGLTPQSVEVAIWSGMRAIEILGKNPHATLVLDIGSESITLGILHKDEISFARKISWGSEEFTLLIQKKLKIDWKEAERLKRECGVAWGIQPSAEEGQRVSLNDTRSSPEIVFEICRPQLSILQQEIQSSLGYFSALTQGQLVEEVILTGGGSLLKEIVPYLSGVLRLPVKGCHPFNPLGREITDGSVPAFHLNFDNVPADGESAEWATALGAALRGYNAGD